MPGEPIIATAQRLELTAADASISNAGDSAMLRIAARVVIGTVLGTLVLVAMVFAYASDLLSTQSRQGETFGIDVRKCGNPF